MGQLPKFNTENETLNLLFAKTIILLAVPEPFVAWKTQVYVRRTFV